MPDAESAHPLASSLRRLFGRLAALRFQLLQSSSAARSFAQAIDEAKRKFQEHNLRLWTGSALVIRDIALWPNDPNGNDEFIKVAKHSAVADECLTLPDVMRRTASAWSMAQAYEAHETFLKDILAATLLDVPVRADTGRLASYKQGRESFDYSCLSDWRSFLESRYRGPNNSRLFALARELAPSLSEAEKRNRAGLDLCIWYSAMSVLRHAVTHSSMVIRHRNLTGLQPEARALLNQVVTIVDRGDEIEILAEPEEAERCIDGFAEYGYLIFRALSRHLGYPDTIHEALQSAEGTE